MNRSVTCWIILLAVAVTSFAMGCRDDLLVEEPPTIDGRYRGIYSYLEVFNVSDTNFDTSQMVDVWFRAPNFSMDMDQNIAESLRVFCDVLGEFELGNGLSMDVTDPNYTRGVCTEVWGPRGTFGLDLAADTIRLLHDSTDATGLRFVKVFRLVNDL